MNQASQSAAKSSQTIHFGCGWSTLPVLLVLVAASFPAQAQQGASLADAARQARAQKKDQPQAEPNKAQEVVNQLEEDQDDAGNAPAGFKTYNAGDYKLWVPAPYTVDGHDDGGIVLASSQAGSARSMVLVGNPLVFPMANGDDAFRDTATQFARTYAQSASCTRTTIASHAAYQCGLAGANLLGRAVSGNAVFVRGFRGIVPVFCVAPTDSRARDILNDPYSTYTQKKWARIVMEREDQNVRNSWHTCEGVLQSIRLKDDGGPATMATAKSSKAPSTPAKQASEDLPADPPGKAPTSSPSRMEAGNTGRPASLAEIAQQVHQSSAPAAKPQLPPDSVGDNDAAPSGFKVHSFTYCKNHTQQCWEASVFIPVDAKPLNSGCKQYVFETKVNGEPFLLLVGLGGTGGCQDHLANDPDLVRWHQLVDQESARAPGTASTISNLQMTLAGKPATITKLGFKKGTADWIGKRADVESNGIQLVVGCMAQRDHFPDGDAICSTLIDSLRLP